MARPIIRAATGITLSKRIQLSALTIPDVSAADYDNPLSIDLVEAVETMDEEQESDGTNVADVPLYSRLMKMRLQCILSAFSAQTLIRWALYKKPDGEALVTSLADSNFHSSNDVQNNREFRKYTLAKGMLMVTAQSAGRSFTPFIRRDAWKRASPMREGDKLCLLIAKNAAGTTGQLDGFGTIWARANG